jgi:hypothetical protein
MSFVPSFTYTHELMRHLGVIEGASAVIEVFSVRKTQVLMVVVAISDRTRRRTTIPSTTVSTENRSHSAVE